jgi:hypothetical protein
MDINTDRTPEQLYRHDTDRIKARLVERSLEILCQPEWSTRYHVTPEQAKGSRDGVETWIFPAMALVIAYNATTNPSVSKVFLDLIRDVIRRRQEEMFRYRVAVIWNRPSQEEYWRHRHWIDNVLKPTLRILDHASHAHQSLVAYPSASASISERLQSLLPSFDKLTVEKTEDSDSGSDEGEAQEIQLPSNIQLDAHENPASNDEALYVLCGIFLAEMQEINVYIKAQFQASANGTINPVIASIIASVGTHLLEKAVSRYSVMEADKLPSATIQGFPGAGFLAIIHSIIAKYESRLDHTTLAKPYHVREEYFSPALQIYLQHFVNHSEGYGNVLGGRYFYIPRFDTRFPLINSTTATLGAANEETHRLYTYFWKSEVAPTLIRSWYHLGQDIYKDPPIISICDRFTKQIVASLVQKKVLEFSPFVINIILDAISTFGSDFAGSRMSSRQWRKHARILSLHTRLKSGERCQSSTYSETLPILLARVRKWSSISSTILCSMVISPFEL